MATEREKPWTLEDLAAWLSYEDVGRALEVVRDHGVPYFWLGPPGKPFGAKGSARYLRFVPSKVEAWAIASLVSREPAPTPAPASLTVPRPVAKSGGWRDAETPAKLRGPRRT